MPIDYKKSKAVFREVVSVDEAEALLEWLHKNPTGKVDLAACTHVHPANLQVLMAAKARIAAMPKDQDLAACLATALKVEQ